MNNERALNRKGVDKINNYIGKIRLYTILNIKRGEIYIIKREKGRDT